MEEEIEKLIKLYKQAETGKESQRYHVILLVKTGSTIAYVARNFFVDEETIRFWVKKWDEEKNIHDKERKVRNPKLAKKQQDACNTTR